MKTSNFISTNLLNYRFTVPENITIGPGSCPLGLPIKEHRSNPDLPKDEEVIVKSLQSNVRMKLLFFSHLNSKRIFLGRRP